MGATHATSGRDQSGILRFSNQCVSISPNSVTWSFETTSAWSFSVISTFLDDETTFPCIGSGTLNFHYLYLYRVCFGFKLRGYSYIKVVGSGVSACKKKTDDLMPRNVTVTNSGKIAQPEIIKMLLFTLAASRLNSKVCLFSLGLSQIIFAAHWSRIKLQMVKTWRVYSRLPIKNHKQIDIL